MVQRRNNGIKPNQPGKIPSGSGFSTRKEWGLSTFSLQIILIMESFISRGEKAWGLLLYYRVPGLHILTFLQVPALVCAIFALVKWPNIWSFTAAHLWATAWFPLCCSSVSKGISRDTWGKLALGSWRNEGESNYRSLGGCLITEGFLLSAIFSTVNTCTALADYFICLFLHAYFCSAPTNNFFLIPQLS